ncbi:hypothetical protein C8F04DRAFT_457210 [Mycena alexandri]|uniref:Uncharacterized protein n=1 Tax=Mycena alexandri TaxID=1745969 RepID=A0AAD6T010_9AGAR|nr:hypothetical protein C8F04DRAFT_457210 [Mycena alexandri]
MMCIRTSTGRLSVDPVPPDTRTELALYPIAASVTSVETSLRQTATPSGPPNAEVHAIESLALNQYHRICFVYLTQYRGGSISTSSMVNIGAVISWPSRHQYEEHVEIASLGKPHVVVVVDDSWWLEGHGAGDLVGNGWSRYRADDVFNTKIMLRVYSYDPEVWLSQANHVFSRLQITSNLEHYCHVRLACFMVEISNPTDPPAGFLFICPREDFRTGLTSFRWPNCPVYWSLDPEGVEVLSTEEAARLGFPSFQLTTKVHGKFWDASVYAGLRKFHQAKGFDPDSQDVALHLGHPLYRLSRAHVEEISADGEADAGNSDGGPDGGHSLYQDAPTDRTEIPALEESPIASPAFRFVTMVQLILIIFLSLCWMYGQVR